MERTLKEIAELIEGVVLGNDQITINGIQSLDDACEGEISFLSDNRYRDRIKHTKASALLVSAKIESFKGPQILVSNPSLAHAKIAGLFSMPVPRFPGVSPEASIDKTCRLGRNVSVYPQTYIGPEVTIGNDVVIFPGVSIGAQAKIGDGSILYPQVTIYHACMIGNRVIIHAGTVIGSDGFGFAQDGIKNIKIPQMGIVQIDDDVEIGAHNTIDRAAFGKTWIQRGVKLDNHIHIAHNVTIGEDTIIAAQTGISGSVQIGKQVIIGGKTGTVDHITIGDRAMIGPGSYVYQSVSSGEVVSGIPIMPHRKWLKTLRIMPRLTEHHERLRRLEKKFEILEKNND
ncbi:MAG: UDP-3-O-(3-hydroxymyristoyl)glucosamine N-acyltransferase [Deltaproteobacteria bacterium]|nr:UDP-3-O-(3-hydroxymyristoyl)glucosamine N-acyltransferase [Deltaproteobacteria bacterium]